MKWALWFRAFGLAVIALTLVAALTAQDDLAAIQQKLQQRITLATLDANGEIVAAGSVVTLQKNSLQMCATTAPPGAGAPANTYKNGKLSAGMFLWNLNLGLLKIDANTIPMHTYVTGDKFWIVGMNVKKNGIELKLWTDPDSNNIRYWSWLEIPFEKKQIPLPDELMNTIAEVLAVDNQAMQQTQNQPTWDQGRQPAQENDSTTATTPAENDQQAVMSGKYDSNKSGAQLIFVSNSTFVMLLPGSKQAHGRYVVNGNMLMLTFDANGVTTNLRIQGDLLVEINDVWIRKGSTQVPHALDDTLKAEVQSMLNAQFTKTVTKPDNCEIVTPGSTVHLQSQDGILLASTVAKYPLTSFYANGHILLNANMKDAWEKELSARQPGKNATNIPQRKFMADERLWFTDYGVFPKGVVLQFCSDTYDGIGYAGQLYFVFSQEAFPSADEVMKTIAEVVIVENGNQQASSVATAPMPEIAPPPPPADAPPPTISLGQTMSQVTAAFGDPLKMARLGVKTIFYYKDMKVTFTNGKVSNVE